MELDDAVVNATSNATEAALAAQQEILESIEQDGPEDPVAAEGGESYHHVDVIGDGKTPDGKNASTALVHADLLLVGLDLASARERKDDLGTWIMGCAMSGTKVPGPSAGGGFMLVGKPPLKIDAPPALAPPPGNPGRCRCQHWECTFWTRLAAV